MKYKTFRNLITLGGATVLAALFGTCAYFAGGNQPASSRTNSAPINSGAQSQTDRASTVAPNGLPSQSQNGQRREEQLILNFLATQPATTDKIKDAFPRESFKVNIYRDEGSTTWTRLKIDLDRDGKDDEKWELKDGQPAKRRIATRDDEQYDREYRWRNSQWVEKN